MSDATGRDVPALLADWLRPFQGAFTAPTWQHVMALIMGAILVPGRRTVASALRMTGLDQTPHFTNYHRVLNRDRWSARWLSRCLLGLLIAAFVPPDQPVVIGLDDTIERRWGAKINKRGIYRDPVRSSNGQFVKASGLRWLSLMPLPEIGWAGRCWALAFLTVLAPSQRYWQDHKPDQRQYKKLTDWGRQVLVQTARWLPQRRIIGVADASFAAIDLLNEVRAWVTMITRLRLDAALHKPLPPRRPGTVGRPAVVGKRLPSLKQRLASRRTRWQPLLVRGWYGRAERLLEIVSATVVWNHPGHRVPIRYVLVRDPTGEREPQAFLCTDLDAAPLEILRWFVRRWSIEVTFAEVRRHLGVETQRQSSDPAIDRTTPVLLGLFSLITFWADGASSGLGPSVRTAAWYRKPLPTFSDALATVRQRIWSGANSLRSRSDRDVANTAGPMLSALIDIACYAA